MINLQRKNNEVFDNKQIRGSIRGFGSVLAYDFEDLGFENKDIIKRLQNLQIVFSNGQDSYTNGEKVVIGKNFPIFEKLTDEQKYRSAQAIVAHEIAHILYTDFNKFRSFITRAHRNYSKFSNLAKVVYNILEDYRIEQRMARHSIFLHRILFQNRTWMIQHTIESLQKNPENFETDEDDSGRVNRVLSSLMITLLNGRRVSIEDDKARKLYNDVLDISIDALKIGTNNSVEEATAKIMELFQNLNFDPRELAKNYYTSSTALNRASGSSSPIEDDGINDNGTASKKMDVGGKDTSDSFTGIFENQNITKMNHKETDGSEITMEEAAEEAYSSAEEVEEEMPKVTEDIVNDFKMSKEVESSKEKIEELYDISKYDGIKLPDLSLSVDCVDNVFNQREYNDIVDSLKYEINQTVSGLKRFIDYFENTVRRKQKTGQLDLKRLTDFAALGEIDIFKRNRRIRKPVELNVSLLIDSSGSNGMTVPGTNMPRYMLNQMMGVFFHEVLREIKFRHSAYSFYSSSKEHIVPLIDANNCFSNGVGKNLASITARGANRDSFHIKIATERLLREARDQGEESGLLIVISDGMPNSAGYFGTSAMAEVKKSVEEAEAKGIDVFGIFTGSEGENEYFEQMYKNHYFLNNESIKDFPKVFGKIVSEVYQKVNR